MALACVILDWAVGIRTWYGQLVWNVGVALAQMGVVIVSFLLLFFIIQCVEYFFQYSLNPSNLAFEEIKRGKHKVSPCNHESISAVGH